MKIAKAQSVLPICHADVAQESLGVLEKNGFAAQFPSSIAPKSERGFEALSMESLDPENVSQDHFYR